MRVVFLILSLFVSFSFSGNLPDCVKGEEGVVICKETGKMWQDDRRCKPIIRSVAKDINNWYEAKDFCEKLNLAGFSDWRLPGADELKKMQYFGKHPYFKYYRRFSYYWTNETKFFDRDVAMCISSREGKERWFNKKTPFDTRCVRDL